MGDLWNFCNLQSVCSLHHIQITTLKPQHNPLVSATYNFFMLWNFIGKIWSDISTNLKNNLISESYPGKLHSCEVVFKTKTIICCWLIRKSLQNGETWHLFYCDGIIGGWVIQDLFYTNTVIKRTCDITRWITKYGISKSTRLKFCRVDVLLELHIFLARRLPS